LLEDSTTMLLTATNQTKRYRALWRVLACLFTVVGFIGVSTGTASALSFSSTVSSSGQSTVVGLETRVGVTTSFSAGSSARLATVRAGCVGENHPGYDSFVSASCVATKSAGEAAGGVAKGPIADAVPRNLPEQMALNSAKAGNGEIIIRNLGDEARLAANYGPGEWVKMQEVVKTGNGNVTVHWFRNLSNPSVNVEFKFTTGYGK
jgi:hypothetical protein